MVSFISEQTANSSRDTEFLFNKRSKIYKCMPVRKLCKFWFHVTIRSHLINTKIWTSLSSSKRIKQVPQNMVHLPTTTKLYSTITGLNYLLYFYRIRHNIERQHNLEKMDGPLMFLQFYTLCLLASFSAWPIRTRSERQRKD